MVSKNHVYTIFKSIFCTSLGISLESEVNFWCCLFVYLFIFVTWNLRPGTKFQIFVKKVPIRPAWRNVGKDVNIRTFLQILGGGDQEGQNRKSGDARFSCNHATRKFVWLVRGVRGWFGLDIFIYQNGNYYLLYHNLTISPFPAHLPPPLPCPKSAAPTTSRIFPNVFVYLCRTGSDSTGGLALLVSRWNYSRRHFSLLDPTLLKTRFRELETPQFVVTIQYQDGEYIQQPRYS